MLDQKNNYTIRRKPQIFQESVLCEDFNILKYSIWQECMSTSGCLGLLKGHTHGEVWEACLWGVSCSLGPCSLGPPATGGVAKRRFVGFGHSILGMYVCNQIVYSLAQSLVSMCCDPARQSSHSTNSICFHLFLITITFSLDLCYYLTNARAPGAPWPASAPARR